MDDGHNHTGTFDASVDGYSVANLTNLFMNGIPSNDPAEAGLTVHCFDGMEDFQDPWLPCTDEAWCAQSGEYWSTSIISSRNWHTAGKAGIIMSPKKTKVLCSYYTDFGSYNRGCDVVPEKHRRRRWRVPAGDVSGHHNDDKDIDPGPPNPYNATMLKHMLQISMNNESMHNWTANALYNADNEVNYNEVLIDSRVYTRNLPGSIAAVVFFDDAADSNRTADANEQARIEATKAYVQLLDKYNLTETDLPLLKLRRPDPTLANEPQQKVEIEDASKGAREYLAEHAQQAYRRRRSPPTWMDPADQP